MDNEIAIILPESQWKDSENKIIFWILFCFGLVILFVFVFIPQFKPHFISVPLSQTVGIKANSEFQFTLSPNNRWILYFENKYPYDDRYNLIVFDVLNNKKFLIDNGEENYFGQWMHNDCWTTDSRYCIMSNEKIIKGTYNTAINFTDLNNPIFTKESIDYKDVLTCSDCGNFIDKEKNFGGNNHGREYSSPDGRYIAQEISYGRDIVTPPDLYINDTKTGNKTFIASNVYYDVHFTSDSKGFYYYGCKQGGACNNQIDHLFYVDLSKPQNFIDRIIFIFSKKKKEILIVPKYSIVSN